MYAHLNGRLVSADDATLSIFDYGLLYGLGLFETMHASATKTLFLEEHMSRLQRGADSLGIGLPFDLSRTAAAIQETLMANSLTEARVRLTVTAGEGQHGPGAPPEGPSIWFITASPFHAMSDEEYERGHRAVISTVRRSSLSVVPRNKTTNLIENMLAQRQARDKGVEQAIMLNEKRCVAECAFSNIFFTAYGALQTPGLDCGILPGITRDAVIGIALKLGLGLSERWINAEEIWDAEEVFITNSVLGVLPITAINGRPIRGGMPGKITRTLTMAYANVVKDQLGA